MEIHFLTYVSSLTAQGKGLKKAIPVADLIPDYLGTRKRAPKEKTPEELSRDFSGWIATYKRKEAEAKGRRNGP